MELGISRDTEERRDCCGRVREWTANFKVDEGRRGGGCM